MTNQHQDQRRSRIGFGSTYAKSEAFPGTRSGIGTILGGQRWQIKPDKKAAASNPCLWMQAGVVAFKNCNNFYDCTTCKYDTGMQRQAAKGKHPSWQDAMRRRPELERVCRHSLTGRIASRACAYDYQCGHCDFDQFFEDVMTPKSSGSPQAMHDIKGFKLPTDYHYHNGHTWARIESGGFIRIGMDDFSGRVLGQADKFELPLMGKALDPGEIGWGMQRKDHQADVRSPVGGVIVEVNHHVREHPDLAKRSPYEAGWLFVVRAPDIKKAVTPLMGETNSIDWLSDEVTHLEHMIEEVAGPLAADGGYLVDDIYGVLPDLGWNDLTRTFLKTG